MAEKFTYKCITVKHNPPPRKKSVVAKGSGGKGKGKGKGNQKNKGNSNTKGIASTSRTKVTGPNGKKKIIKRVNVIRSEKDLKRYKRSKRR